MTRRTFPLVTLFLATATMWAGPPETVPPTPPDRAAPEKAPSEAGTMRYSPPTALEQQFQEMLSGATLRGSWQMTGEGGLTGKSPLTDPKPEVYTITDVSKISHDLWLVTARIQIAEDKDVTLPVPVRVVWSGDTPIITLDDVNIPTLGTYSARVMLFRGFYSGTWLSNTKNYGGVMAGRIIKKESSPPPPATKTPEAKG